MNNPGTPPPRPEQCELCGRRLEALTKHHLIPRTRHRKPRAQRTFARADLLTRILWICRPCHDHIHDVLTEKELETHYHTRDTLLAHPAIVRFVTWIGRKPPGFRPVSRSMKRTTGE